MVWISVSDANGIFFVDEFDGFRLILLKNKRSAPEMGIPIFMFCKASLIVIGFQMVFEEVEQNADSLKNVVWF